MFKGSLPAMVTPFNNGEVDENELKKLVNWHIEQGSHGLVPVGTTVESPTQHILNMSKWLAKLLMKQPVESPL